MNPLTTLCKLGAVVLAFAAIVNSAPADSAYGWCHYDKLFNDQLIPRYLDSCQSLVQTIDCDAEDIDRMAKRALALCL